MKKIVLSLAIMALAAATYAQKKVADVAKFNSETIELGKIKQGTPTSAKFIVTNIGSEPLLIEQANPTCGCTISDYTKSPIMPGKTGYINATYNAAAAGHFDKHLTVKFAGVDEMKSITISGDVVAANEVAPAEVAPTLVKAPETKPVVDAAPTVSVKPAKKSKKVKKVASSK
jgi:Protein of unknown function (DUF1573)